MVGTAAEAILLAAAANMVTKIAARMVVGGYRFGWELARNSVLALASGALALVEMGMG